MLHAARLQRALGRYQLPRVVNEDWKPTASRFRRCRLPSYMALHSQLAHALADWPHIADIATLWADVFDQAPPGHLFRHDPMSAELAFTERFAHSALWFPLDTEGMDSMAMEAGEYVIGHQYPILLDTVAPQWDEIGIEGMEYAPAIEPLAALRPDLLAGLLGDFPDGQEDAIDWAATWLAEQGYPTPPRVAWSTWLDAEVEAALRALPAPLNGLVVAWWVLTGSSNPFLSSKDYWDNGYCWCRDCVHALSNHYTDIEVELAAWGAYEVWYGQDATNPREAIHALINLQRVPVQHGPTLYQLAKKGLL